MNIDTVKNLGAILSLCLSVWAVYKVIIEIQEPRKALEEKVKVLEKWHREDHERIKDIEGQVNDIFKCVYQLVRHEATGNGTEDFSGLLSELDDKVKLK